MHFPTILVLICLLTLAACTKPKAPHDPALAAALEELARLKSYTETGVSYHDYADRLLTSKANIDVVLQRTNDVAAKGKVQKAVGFYLAARSSWQMEIENKVSTITAQECWKDADRATQVAAQFAFAEEAARRQIDAIEAARESQKTMERAEAEAARRAKEAKTAEEARLQSEKEQARLAAEESATNAKLAAAAESAARELARAAEAERIRRFAPSGTGFNVVATSIKTPEGIHAVSPGSLLKITKENADGTVTFEYESRSGVISTRDITIDRDFAREIRADDRNSQDVIKRWRDLQNTTADQIKANQIRISDAERDEINRRRNAPLPPRKSPLDLSP